MALSKIDAANFLTGTIPSGNVANATLNAVTALPGAIATGQVLQIVTTHKTTYFETTSSSFVDVTGASVAITPSATSSKVLFIIQGTYGKYENGNFHLNVLRDSTDIMTNVVDPEHPNQNYDYYFGNHIIDTPSSTSELTYKIQVKTDGAGTTAINSRASSPANRGTTTLTVMEIAG